MAAAISTVGKCWKSFEDLLWAGVFTDPSSRWIKRYTLQYQRWSQNFPWQIANDCYANFICQTLLLSCPVDEIKSLLAVASNKFICEWVVLSNLQLPLWVLPFLSLPYPCWKSFKVTDASLGNLAKICWRILQMTKILSHDTAMSTQFSSFKSPKSQYVSKTLEFL